MISNKDSFFILDFGIARMLDEKSLTATAARFGPATLGYAAPEQFNNIKKQIDSRTDLFSIGIVIYECITGINPLMENTLSPFEIIAKMDDFTIKKLEIKNDKDGSLSNFIDVLMQKWPSRRPRNANEALRWFKEIKNNL